MKYELLYIVPSRFAENEVAGVQERVGSLIKAAGGTILREENLGRIKLAYPIKQTRHGTYILVHFESETSAVKSLNEQLRLSNEVLRHLILHLPKGAEKKAVQIEAYVAPLSEEAEARGEGRPVRRRPPTPVLPPPTPVRAVEAKPMSIEELDKKLDEILESDLTENV